jgi:hypothetical protein
MRRRLLATALLLATLAAPPAPACSIISDTGGSDLLSAVAADRDSVWTTLHLGDGRLRAARFSAMGSLERELVLAVPGAELDSWGLVVDRRGRLWLQAHPAWDEDSEAEWEDRTWAVVFSPRGKLLARFEITGWGRFEIAPDGEIYVERTSDEEGGPGLAFARVRLGGLEPLFTLATEELFEYPRPCANEGVDAAPLAGGRFAVLRTWGGDGWLSIYDARGGRLARWPFWTEGGGSASARVSSGSGSGVTISYSVYEGREERRGAGFDASGERRFEILLPAETEPDLVPLASGGFWAYTSWAGTLRRFSPTGMATAAFDLDPPPDGISWSAHAARQRELAQLPADAPAERWLDALLYGDAATSARAGEQLVAQGRPALPVLLDRLDHHHEIWPLVERILAADPAAPAAVVAHLAGAERAARIAFVRWLGEASPLPPAPVLEIYRDLLEDLYVSGTGGESAASPALDALPLSDRIVAHQIEEVLERGRSPFFLDAIFVRFPTVAAAIDAALAGPPMPRHHAVELLHSLLEQLEHRPPDESPQLEQELRDRSRRWATSPDADVALAGSLLALATGDAAELPRLLDETKEKQRQGSSAAAILRLLRFYPEALDEPAIDALLEALHCRDCRHHPRLVAALRPLLGTDDFARAVERYHRLPADEPLPERLFATLTRELPRLGESELLAFLDDPRLHALGPSHRLASFLDRVHRFAADRPGTQQAARDAFHAVFTPEAVRQAEPDVEPKNLFAAAHETPRFGHWLGALEPAPLHGLMDEVTDDLLAAIEPPQQAAVARKARAGPGFAEFVERSGREIPEHLREWGTSVRFETGDSDEVPEPPGLPGILHRLDRLDGARRARWLAELGAQPRQVEAALLTRLDDPERGRRAAAHALLAEMGSARAHEAARREIDAALAAGELPPAHLLAALTLHGDEIPTAALELAAKPETAPTPWVTVGTALATDRLARHLRDRAWQEDGTPAIGAVRLLAALDDELAADFVTELAAHHRDPEVAAAARERATTRRWH